MLVLWGVGLIATLMVLGKLYTAASRWLESPLNRWALSLTAILALGFFTEWIRNKGARARDENRRKKAVLGPEPNSVFCGKTTEDEAVFIKTRQRAMHTQVIGTTNAGKTESVILPWAIQDIQQGRGLLLIDGKADRGLLDKLWAYTKAAGREKDFRLFSLSHIEESSQFNPLLGGTPEEVSERVFNSFEFENSYYRSVQFEVFSQMMRIFCGLKIQPTFLRLHEAITSPRILRQHLDQMGDPTLQQWLSHYIDLPPNERVQRTSGLAAALSQFSFGQMSILFNSENPGISLDEALRKEQIIYFQLPVLLAPFLGKATGKMVLQVLQSAVANRHRGNAGNPKFYSVFLDDFTEYLYPGFVSVLNKSRSANVGVVFAHQALGDIKTLGDAIANSIVTNANLKVFMRGNDPESAEYFSKVIGTVKTVKYTERTRRELLRNQNTGDASAREVDEFIIHPNYFKSELGVGQAVMVVPHEAGSRTIRIRFQKFPDLEPAPLNSIEKVKAQGLVPLKSSNEKEQLRSLNSQNPFHSEAS